ncbi:protein kinase, partial [bacterium]|nr:protein kinase [bacterium]
MDCTDIEALLAARPVDELPTDQAEPVKEHLAACSVCRARWDPAYQSTALHTATKPVRDPARIRDSVMARIRGETTGIARADTDSMPAPPKKIGGYKVLGIIGRGGMGTVLKARQVSMDRLVALKVLPPRLAKDEAFVRRFVREARAAATLRHPHIVQGHDAGLADGTYYFAMEYVDGEGLDALIAREGPLPPKRALEIMRQVVSALWAAHEAGIVHRDIKPSNLMLDSKGEVRVTDFGLAKRTDAPADVATELAQGDAAPGESQALGTPAYVAPEVAEGKPADPRSDLYSLGATFFHLLAGRPPFEGKDLADILQKQINEPPPPLASVAPRVDPRLCAVIDRLLCKDPADRFPSA